MFADPKRIPLTGHPLIDLAHQRLANIINAAYEQWQSQAPKEQLLDTLREFIRQVSIHFAEEEAAIKAAGWERWQEHQAIHKKLLVILHDVLARLEASDQWGSEIVDTFTELDRLLFEHEFLDDQEFWALFTDQPPTSQADEELITWSDQYKIGDEAIDRQHQTLVKMLNRLHGAIENQADAQEILTQLREIGAHTAWHFSFEETCMAKHDLPGREAHHILHQSLLEDLTRVISEFEAGRYMNLEDLLENYLKYWLLDHIVHVDLNIPRAMRNLEANPTKG